MPTKKETKKKNTKKKVTKQKQKQSQVQKVIVNINKPSAKSSKPRQSRASLGNAGAKGSESASASTKSQPKFEAESNPYPSYVRQAAAVAQPVPAFPVAVAQPVPAFQNAGRRIGETPNLRYYENETDTTLKPPLKQRPEQLLANNKELLKKDLKPDIAFETLHKEPSDYFVQENPLKKKAKPAAAAATRRRIIIVDEDDDEQGFQPVGQALEESKPKRSYTKRKEGPRKDSLADLNQRYEAATGMAYSGENIKALAFKELVERLESEEQ